MECGTRNWNWSRSVRLRKKSKLILTKTTLIKQESELLEVPLHLSYTLKEFTQGGPHFANFSLFIYEAQLQSGPAKSLFYFRTRNADYLQALDIWNTTLISLNEKNKKTFALASWTYIRIFIPTMPCKFTTQAAIGWRDHVPKPNWPAAHVTELVAI